MAAPRNNLGPSRPSAVSDFKKKQTPTALPSGNAIVLKKTSITGFLAAGTIPNSLMQTIQAAMNSKGGQTEKKIEAEVAKLLEDPEGMRDMFIAVDAFVCAVAIEPKVYPVPENEADRKEDQLYVDELELDDKMFIFQRAVGATDDAAPFRKESAPGVGSVPASKAVGGTTKRAPRARKP